MIDPRQTVSALPPSSRKAGSPAAADVQRPTRRLSFGTPGVWSQLWHVLACHLNRTLYLAGLVSSRVLRARVTWRREGLMRQGQGPGLARSARPGPQALREPRSEAWPGTRPPGADVPCWFAQLGGRGPASTPSSSAYNVVAPCRSGAPFRQPASPTPVCKLPEPSALRTKPDACPMPLNREGSTPESSGCASLMLNHKAQSQTRAAALTAASSQFKPEKAAHLSSSAPGGFPSRKQSS